jgi:hypothetical protein
VFLWFLCLPSTWGLLDSNLGLLARYLGFFRKFIHVKEEVGEVWIFVRFFFLTMLCNASKRLQGLLSSELVTCSSHFASTLNTHDIHKVVPACMNSMGC